MHKMAAFTAAVNSVLPTTPSQNAQNQDYLLLVINMTIVLFSSSTHSYGNLKPGPGFTALLLSID